MDCQACGTTISEDADRCEACGAAVITDKSVMCSECGETNPPAAAFCRACGHKLETESPPDETPATDATTAPSDTGDTVDIHLELAPPYAAPNHALRRWSYLSYGFAILLLLSWVLPVPGFFALGTASFILAAVFAIHAATIPSRESQAYWGGATVYTAALLYAIITLNVTAVFILAAGLYLASQGGTTINHPDWIPNELRSVANGKYNLSVSTDTVADRTATASDNDAKSPDSSPASRPIKYADVGIIILGLITILVGIIIVIGYLDARAEAQAAQQSGPFGGLEAIGIMMKWMSDSFQLLIANVFISGIALITAGVALRQLKTIQRTENTYDGD